METWLKWLIATACVVVIAAGGLYGLSKYQTCGQAKLDHQAANDPAILICEAVAKARLKSPSSYKRIEATIDAEKAFITYDAVNSYNAPLRGSHVCEFSLDKDGQNYSFAKSGDMDTVIQNTARLTEEIKASGKDGSYAKREREFDRRLADQMKKGIEVAGFAILDDATAKKTGLQPIPKADTALSRNP